MPVNNLIISSRNLRNIIELDESCPCAEQPQNTLFSNIRLKRHQLALLYRCQQFEKKEIYVKCEDQSNSDHEENNNENNESQINVNDYDILTTHFGLICDQTGAGKSYDILALIASDSNPETSTEQVSSLCNDKLVIRKREQLNRSFIRTNLLIVPSHLIRQWEQYISSFLPRNMKAGVFSHKTQTDRLFNRGIEYFDLLVMTGHFYKRFTEDFAGTDIEDMVFKRIIIDEVDSFHVPRLLKAGFYWYVTASVKNLLYPNGNIFQTIEGFKYSSAVKNEMIQLYQNETLSAKALMIKNSQHFINQSYSLPDIDIKTVRCVTPVSINILLGVVDRRVIESLNANDYDSAIGFYGVRQRTTENNIVQLFVEKLQHNIANIDNEMNFRSTLFYYENPEEKERDRQNMEEKKRRLQDQIANIERRIQKTNECSICFEQIYKKTVVNCCSNPFCFKCINMWFSKSSQCPLCKTSLTKNNIYIVDENEAGTSETPSSSNIDTTQEIHPNNTKERNLINIIKSLNPQNRRILLFTKYNVSSEIKQWLHDNNIQYNEPKGNKFVVDKAIEGYKNGRTQILFLNPDHFGSGLNLENTSDIIIMHKMEIEMEQQVIGRAQRYGRTTSLRVWYLLHENEQQVNMTHQNTNTNTNTNRQQHEQHEQHEQQERPRVTIHDRHHQQRIHEEHIRTVRHHQIHSIRQRQEEERQRIARLSVTNES